MAKTALNEKSVLIPRERKGTKNFMDVRLSLREKDFESVAGKFFLEILPPKISKCFKRAILETGIKSEDAFVWLEHALSENGRGESISPIAQSVYANPYNPYPFIYLYGERDALSAMDKGYILTTGAHAIYLRLQSIVARLPKIIKEEREKLQMKTDEKYVIYNIGSAHSLDTIYALADNPDLRNLVRVVCIDPDKDSLSYGEELAERLGLAECFQFIPSKIEKASIEKKAHLILFIGMFCPVPSKICAVTLRFIKNFLCEEGIIIFSTVQEKMLMEGPILDFIMWSYGWRMYFKTNNEPGRLVRLAGLVHDKAMDWEDTLGHNRMTVARKTNVSKVNNFGNLVKTLML